MVIDIIKRLLNKQEGFTLVELLAVLTILTIIIAIAIPAIGNVIGRADDDAGKVEVELIEDAARLYVVSEEKEINFDAQSKHKVTVKKLIEQGYLEDRSKNNSLGGEVIITKKDNGSLIYEYSSKTPATSR